MKRCPTCKKAHLTKGTTAVHRTMPFRGGKARAVVENVPALVCRACGEAVVAGEDLARAEILAASRLIEAGARSGALLSWTRRALGLLATDMAALLGITAETVSRWENDRVEPEPAVWNAVADLVDDRLEGRTRTHDRLSRGAASSRSLEVPVTVRFRRSATRHEPPREEVPVMLAREPGAPEWATRRDLCGELGEGFAALARARKAGQKSARKRSRSPGPRGAASKSGG